MRGFATTAEPADMSADTPDCHRSDEAFLAAFLESRLDKADFDHRGHLRAAWLLLQRQPLEQAVESTCDGIRRLAAALGVPGKYHRTATEALVRLMAQAGAAERGLGFEAFLASAPQLVADARGLLARHYSPERLALAAAREGFVEPDLLALPR